MMVIVPRIAVVPCLDATPFIYGIRCAANLHTGLTTASSPSELIRLYLEGSADIALVPSSAVPSLPDAELVTEYCIGSTGAVRSAVLAGQGPASAARRVFLDPEAAAAAQLAAYLYKRHWRTNPEFFEYTDPAQADMGGPGDLFLLTGERALESAGRFPEVCDLGAEWTKTTRQPFAFAVWVARRGMDPEAAGELQQALTYGLEHTYEAAIDAGYADKVYDAYGHLACDVDYLFDLQKRKALQKFWDSGIKVAPRANPG